MNSVYEEPEKTRMRNLAVIALDQAGFTLVSDPVRIALPTGAKIIGSLVGDMQSINSRNVRTFYYLRPGSPGVVPKWIANLARSSHAIESGEVYIVVTDYASGMVESCKDNGCGLLRVSDEGTFEMVVDYTLTRPSSLEEVIEERLTEIRREMEHKVDSTRKLVDAKYSQYVPLIPTIHNDKADDYTERFDSQYRSIDKWGDDMSRRLDELGPRSSIKELDDLEALIATGPPRVEGLL